MGLDYTRGCVNFRDVGEWINLLAGSPVLPPGRLLRGGKLDFVADAAEIGRPGTIINLRNGPDPAHCDFGAECRHLPARNDSERYHTADPRVRRWLTEVLRCIAGDVRRWPLLVQCTSGKDRTGVVVAAVLKVMDLDRELIVQEYLLSDGEVRREWIEGSLAGIGDVAAYFQRVDLAAVRRGLLGDQVMRIRRC